MITIDLLLTGYDQAFSRLTSARDEALQSGDAATVYIPLLETLGWADVIEEWLQKKSGEEWMRRLGSDTEKSQGIILGFRYARNVVHHDWALAVELNNEPPLLQDWRWKNNLQSLKPQPKNEAGYKRYLAGRALRHTFRDLHVVYNLVAQQLPRPTGE